MTAATASAKLIDPVLQVARHFQQDPGALLTRIGISREAIKPAGARIPAALFSTLLQELALNTGNPRIALRAGEATQPRMLGSAGFLMSTAPTLGSAYQVLNDYLPLLIEGVHLSLERGEQGATLLLDLEDDSDRPLAEWLLACLHNWPRWLTGKQMPLQQVDLAFEEPPSRELHEQFFAAEVRFAADRNRLHFAAEVLDQPCLDASDELFRHHQQFADQLLSSAGRDGALVAQVKSLIRNRIATDNRPLAREEVARQLNLSLRTLQRKLDQHGTHFQALYDQTRRELALQMIHRGDRSFGEIGYLLGFSGLSAFQKAFKRWTGQAPGQYRDSQRPRTILPDQQLPRTLAELVAKGELSEAAFYPLALQLLSQLRQHGQQQLPLLTPSSINVTTDDRGAQQLSFNPHSQNLTTPLLEQFAYTAPEANGLLPERPRVASTLYQLGCLYYFLLHGSPPHSASEPGALLRVQLDQTPLLDKRLTPTLRAILGKLLSLAIDQRYQTPHGLEQDLRQAQLLLTQGVTDEPLTLGGADRPETLIGYGQLVGRQGQQQLLEQLLQRSRHNDGRLLLLEGSAGSGKSALLDSLRIAVFRSQGVQLRIALAPGDQRRRLEPLILPLRRLLRIKLAAPSARRELLAQQLRRQLGARLALLLPLLPELKLLLGGVDASAGAAGQPIEPLLQALVGLFAAQRDPLLLFFDDLQHASAELLALIQQLLPRLGRQPLLLAAAYDPAQIASRSPLQRVLPLLRAHRQSLSVELPALAATETQHLLRQLLGELTPETQVLGDWLQQRSNGNPGQLQHELEALCEADKLRFDSQRGRWRWLPEQLPPSMAREFEKALAQALQQLPATTLEMLQWAAVIGDSFELALLAEARQDPPARIEIHLWPAEQAGVLRPGATHTGRFSHPGLPERLLAQLDSTTAAELHWRVARVQLQQQPPPPAAARAEHLARAYRLRPDPTQRLPLIRLHREAALAADSAADASAARHHYQAAQTLLEATDCAREAELCTDIFTAGLAQLLRLDAVDATAAWEQRLTQLDRLPLCPALTCQRLIAQSRLQQRHGNAAAARALLLDGLRDAGVEIPTRTAPLYLALDAPPNEQVTRSPYPTGAVASLLDELQSLAEQQLEPALLFGTLHSRQQLTGAPLDRQLLRHQLLGEPFAALPATGPHSPPDLHQKGLNAARRLPWCAPLKRSIDALDETLTQARSAGQPGLARQLLLPLYNSRWFADEPLTQVREALAEELTRLPHDSGEAGALQHSAARLIDWLLDPAGDATVHPAPITDTNASGAHPWALLGDCAVSLLSQQRQRWPALVRAAQMHSHRLGGLLAEAQLLLFSALMAAELAHHALPAERRRWLHHLQQQAARFEYWATANPPNFAAIAALLQAEIAALGGRDSEATGHFENAISATSAGESWLLAALTTDRFRLFWQRRRHATLARLMAGEARAAYQRGGATAPDWISRQQGVE